MRLTGTYGLNLNSMKSINNREGQMMKAILCDPRLQAAFDHTSTRLSTFNKVFLD